MLKRCILTDFAVKPEKNLQLQKKMTLLNILESELEENFIRCSGRGGQKVNKTSAGVYIKHIPTGIEVKCMKERSQSINRFLARRLLAEKIEAAMKGDGDPTLNKTLKAKKQKLKRKSRAVAKYSYKTQQGDNNVD
ncbi:class I peptide chain release factor [Candidatus Omnitrophus magneticus]|uniref:Class I peptide chain release factor n=1 Tax=Candidatus Omnitrophus magneticus TaxID=1609969 RepID=A0A0F0CT91_9BACT|nr:class I peptide chain release factor [Candidatus Omnitrophus magneticus]